MDIITAAPTQTISTTKIPPGSNGFKVAAIVLGVIAGVAVLIIIAMSVAMICIKKRTGQYSVHASNILQKFSYSNI